MFLNTNFRLFNWTTHILFGHPLQLMHCLTHETKNLHCFILSEPFSPRDIPGIRGCTSFHNERVEEHQRMMPEDERSEDLMKEVLNLLICKSQGRVWLYQFLGSSFQLGISWALTVDTTCIINTLKTTWCFKAEQRETNCFLTYPAYLGGPGLLG